MKKITLLIIATAILASCTTQHKIKKCDKWGVCKTDTIKIEYTETVHDTIVTIEKSEAYLDLYLECDSAGQVYIRSINKLETENTNLKFKMVNGQMIVYLEVPSEEVVIKYKTIVSKQYEHRTLKVPYKSKFMTFKTYWFFGTALFIILFILNIIRKIIK